MDLSDPVEDLFERLRDVSQILREKAEISLETSLDDVHRKALLLAAASYFEFKLTGDVQAFCDATVGIRSPISGLVKVKAITRQYHTWFDWDKSNANKFFSLFGPEFKKWMDIKLSSDDDLAKSIINFMSVGSDRNRLVHQNFGIFTLEASPNEIMDKYKSARTFVEGFKDQLAEFAAEEPTFGTDVPT